MTDNLVRIVNNVMDVDVGELTTAQEEDGSTSNIVQSLETQLNNLDIDQIIGYQVMLENIAVDVSTGRLNWIELNFICFLRSAKLQLIQNINGIQIIQDKVYNCNKN